MRKHTLSRLACSVLATLALALVMVADGAKPAAATTKVEAIRLCQQLPGRCKINAVRAGNDDIQICVGMTNAGCEHWVHCPGKGKCHVVAKDAPTTTGPKAPPIARIIQKDTDTKGTPKGGVVTLTRAAQPTAGPKLPPTTGPTVPVPPKPVVQAGVTPPTGVAPKPPIVPPTVPTGYVSVGGGKTYGVDPQRRK